MQLLGVISKLLGFSSFAVVMSTPVAADIRCNSESITTPDVVICSQESFSKIDKVLNEQYKALSSELNSSAKQSLITVQKSWINLKENYCRIIYDEISPGQEARIDELSCLTQLTSFRVSELIYFRTGVVGDGFYKAVSLVSQKSTNQNNADAVKYVAGVNDLGPLWQEYAKNNCAMAKQLYNEVNQVCLARMRYQMPAN
ncbi:lysozyme inhibitor LprI family protein [Pseudomonas sp. LS44]|uniref:lysozyme inhibitor LprI family protein n=1 Tax=Pseudomonas sp. LS44 TaxID=1357074 RepID=UPI00215A29B1|nr:lysozyme inhibitor LprI family protein [Pseudomonas sp. LS44]UVE17780.1 lysozyme inhibitor LprI family protein [Pseudomonas sp. LS44]